MADNKVIVIPEGMVCDYIDEKFRKDTPEEYVRQTIEKRILITGEIPRITNFEKGFLLQYKEGKDQNL